MSKQKKKRKKETAVQRARALPTEKAHLGLFFDLATVTPIFAGPKKSSDEDAEKGSVDG